MAVRLVAKAHATGRRLLIVADRPRLEALDKALWAADPDSFLPHAIAGGADDAEQPILLAEAATGANGAEILMLLETGVPAALEGYERVLNLFEEGGEGLVRARTDWKALLDREGLTRSYWQQKDGGGWEKRG